MDTYSAKVKIPGTWGWMKFDKVIGDGIEDNFQFLVLEDQSYIRLPLNAVIVFSKERYYHTLKSMEKVAGQKLPSA